MEAPGNGLLVFHAFDDWSRKRSLIFLSSSHRVGCFMINMVDFIFHISFACLHMSLAYSSLLGGSRHGSLLLTDFVVNLHYHSLTF